MSALSSYKYFSSRMALIGMVPAALLAFKSGVWIGFKFLLGFFLISQLAALMLYKDHLLKWLRQRLRK